MRHSIKRRLLIDERGFTLTEVLVTMIMMVVVLFALYSLFDMSLRVFSVGNDKTEAIANARLGLEKMKREIQAAFPYNKANSSTTDDYLFWNSGTPGTAAIPSANSITFANDLNGNYRVDTDLSTEQITYYARSTANPSNPCNSAASAPCTLYRTVGTGIAQPVVEYLTFDNNGTPADTTDDIQGVRFEYLDANGNTATNESNIAIVRIKLKVAVDRGIENQPVKQTLTTDVALRNRGEQ